MREPQLHAYLDDRCGPVPDYLYTVERNTHLYALKPQMITGHMQGRFLVWLTGWLASAKTPTPDAFRVLEVGTFTGYSALCFAEALRGTQGRVTTIEANDELEQTINKHVELAGFRESVELHIGDANRLLETLPGPFDLVYLDGKKDDYPTQFDAALKLLAPGGHILFDNVLWDGHVLDPSNHKATTTLLRDFTRSLATDERFETLMLPMRDGLFLVRRR